MNKGRRNKNYHPNKAGFGKPSKWRPRRKLRNNEPLGNTRYSKKGPAAPGRISSKRTPR